MIVLSWVLYLRMRSIAQAFNGFRMAIWTLIIFSLVLIISMIINIIKGSNESWGRIVIALTNMVLLNGYIWLILGPPVIGHMFFRERTMRKFMNTLHKDSLIAQQNRGVELNTEIYGISDNDVYGPSGYANESTYATDNMFFLGQKTESSNYDFRSPSPAHTTNTKRLML
ncbi:hypothetical protein GGI07_000520 [Coemansia sp. Benny D115]|nr:hypothetical protein GGI07_000520 [Coemansia sp. Benny D115]